MSIFSFCPTQKHPYISYYPFIFEVNLAENIQNSFFKNLFEAKSFDISLGIVLFEDLLDGKLNDIQAAAFLTALAAFPDNPDFLAKAALQVLKRGQKLPSYPHSYAFDTCGTGGDYSSSFNISTTVAFIIAACGVPVIKHGNRSSTSNSGSSDVLQYLGISIDFSPEVSEKALKEVGICFCFAPQYYPFLKNLAPIRKTLGFRTIFNQIGPLVNPGGAKTHLLGVSRFDFLDLFANALLQMGKEGIVVCGGNKLDEVVLDAPNEIRLIKNGSITSKTLVQTDFGLEKVSLNEIKVDSIKESAGIIQQIFDGKFIPAREVVLANSALALLAAGKVSNVLEGVEMARSVIDQGKVKYIFEKLKTFSC